MLIGQMAQVAKRILHQIGYLAASDHFGIATLTIAVRDRVDATLTDSGSVQIAIAAALAATPLAAEPTSEQAEVIAGLNLPMLIKLASVRGPVRSLLTLLIVFSSMLVAGASGVMPSGLSLPGSSSGWAALASLVVLYGLAFTLLFVCVPRLNMAQNAPVMNIEPIATLLLGWALLDQRLSTWQLMGGAVVVTFLGYRMAWRRAAPWLADRFHVPAVMPIDPPLVLGAVLFGVGWGLAGYCPGPALATLLTGNHEVWWFVPAMLAGGLLQRWQARRSA